MFEIGGLFSPLPHLHSGGLSPYGTVMPSIIFLRAVPRWVPIKRALENLVGTSCRSVMFLEGHTCLGIKFQYPLAGTYHIAELQKFQLERNLKCLKKTWRDIQRKEGKADSLLMKDCMNCG